MLALEASVEELMLQIRMIKYNASKRPKRKDITLHGAYDSGDELFFVTCNSRKRAALVTSPTRTCP